MSADVWDFAEAGGGVDCGGKAGDYESGGRGGGCGAEGGAGLAGEEVDRERCGGGNCSERDDAVCGGCAEVCAEAWRDDGGGDVQLADAGGAAGENRDCAGGGDGSADGVDAVAGGDVAKRGAGHGE